jgi:hypothetical protein
MFQVEGIVGTLAKGRAKFDRFGIGVAMDINRATGFDTTEDGDPGRPVDHPGPAAAGRVPGPDDAPASAKAIREPSVSKATA